MLSYLQQSFNISMVRVALGQDKNQGDSISSKEEISRKSLGTLRRWGERGYALNFKREKGCHNSVRRLTTELLQ